MRGIIIIAILLISGCDRIVSEKREAAGTGIESVHCTHPGFCMECGLNFDGSFDCAPKFKYTCSGSQKAEVEYFYVHRVWESGDRTSQKDYKVIKTLEACS